ncbi:MAG: hypothetical protein AAFY28_05720 [Actinomycetota bacterium]
MSVTTNDNQTLETDRGSRPQIAVYGIMSDEVVAYLRNVAMTGPRSVLVRDPHDWLDDEQGSVVVVLVDSDADIGVIRSLVAAYPEVAVVGALINSDRVVAERVFRAGAMTVIDLSDPPEESATSLSSAVSGYVRFPARFATSIRKTKLAVDGLALAEEEINWLRLLGSGASASDIARESHHSLRTMQRRLAALFERMGAVGTTDAVAIAYESGYL